jgi:peptidoglycan hydrolase CwlO-like protein
MSDIERWWRNDSSIFHLRDVPPRSETGTPEVKKEETSPGKTQPTSVGEIPLNNSQPARPLLEDEPVDVEARRAPASGTETRPAQPPKTIAAASAAAPASNQPVARPPMARKADETLAAPIHREPPKEPRARRSGGLWAAVVILALALAAVTGYGALVLRRNNISIAQLPGMNRLITGLNGRMDATETKLRDLTSNWGNVQNHVAALDRKLGSNLQLARRQAQDLVDQAQTRIEAEVGRNNQRVDARLSRLESGQQDDQKRLAELGNQVGGARQEIGASRDETQRDMASLRQEVDHNGNDIRALGQKIERQKVTFEATKNKPQELVPGISMTVTKTNVNYQRFEGYLTLAADSRTIWLPDTGAQQSVVFVPRQSSRPYDLVVTAVRPDGVVGYLMLPASEDHGQGAAGGAGAAATAPGL